MKFKKPLARQLLFWILLSSSIITLCITCLHFYVDYKNDMSAIDARLQQVKTSYLPTISSALWTEDDEQIQVQINGISNLPEILLVQLKQQNIVKFSQGDNTSHYTQVGTWPILYNFDGHIESLGELTVITDLVPVYERLAEKALLTLITQGTKTFIISFIIFFIVYIFVGRHISNIANSMSEFSLLTLKVNNLKLNRKKNIDDELSYLVNEYNNLQINIQKSFEELTIQKQKAEAVNQLKSEFLANISHEVKTPMNGVFGMTHLLLSTSLNDKQQEYVEVIKSSAVHMIDLLNSILDFSKIEANKLEINVQAFDLPKLINETASLIKPNILKNNLEFEVITDPCLLHLIEGDETRLRQVLINLLNNAAKFTTTGKVTLITEVKENGLEKCKIKFSVLDTGIGIPEDKLDVIFDKFRQADNSTTRNFGGTGLGLSICQNLVDKMGGILKVQSTEKLGSYFYFTLTFTVTNIPLAHVKHNLPSLSGLKVLIVDDYEFNTRVMDELLSSWHMRTTTLNKPKLAIREIQIQDSLNDSYDFIFIDKCMPEIDGYQVYDEIRNANLKNIPKVLLTSTNSQDDDKDKCHQLGIDAFITLPTNHAKIQQVLLDLLYKSKPTVKDKSKITTLHSQHELTILLVEDSLVNQKVCIAILESICSNILIANNGKEGIDLFKKNNIDIILMDCYMPLMDGFEAAIMIRKLESPNIKPIPILAITACNESDRLKCLEVGINEVIEKPYIPDDLLKKIQSYLPKHKQVLFS